mgnify:CR=1 FL=1
MPLPIVNAIASWFLKKRIHQIDLFLKYPIDVQDELLKGLIHKAKSTEIGKQYDFKSINNYIILMWRHHSPKVFGHNIFTWICRIK